jgi:hypothetical protein
MQWMRCRANLEVHHKRHRSQSGDDSEQNLITLYISYVPLKRAVTGCSWCTPKNPAQGLEGKERFWISAPH